jgi:conjugative transfer signal peptidase TraF
LTADPSSVRAGRIRRASALVATAMLIAAALAGLAALHLTLNLTASMPLGFYRKLAVERAPARGDVVLVCAPEALARFAVARGFLPPGTCATGTAPLLKRVAAVGGDVVELRADAVVVNGVPLPHSATRSTDTRGRPLPHFPGGRHVLRSGEIWLWTPSPIGWDSRYYGPLPVREVQAFAAPFAVLPQR